MSDEKLLDRRAADIGDDENPEWTDADFARAEPARKVLGQAGANALVRGRGRPPKPAEERKRQVTLRMSPDVIDAARSTGRGWQLRAEEALRREFLGGQTAPKAGGKASTKGLAAKRSSIGRAFTSKRGQQNTKKRA